MGRFVIIFYRESVFRPYDWQMTNFLRKENWIILLIIERLIAKGKVSQEIYKLWTDKYEEEGILSR